MRNLLSKKLNQAGFDHAFLSIAVVVIVVIIGVGYMVLSHAAPSASIVKSGEVSVGISNSAGKPMCLDDYQNKTINGNAVNIYPCSTTDAAEKWQLYSDNTIHHNGKCLDVFQQAKVNGGRIDLYSCNNGSNQKWTVGKNPAVSLNDLIGVQSGLCLDVFASLTANNSKVDIWQCDSTDAQSWGWNTGSTIVPAGSTAAANCNYIGGFQDPGLCVIQVGALQNNLVNAQGASANIGQYSPKCSLNCGHAVTQMQLYSYTNGGKNIIEYGWNTNTSYSTPHLGIGLWANGQPLNADANFVQVSSTIKINQALTSGATAQYKIQFVSNQWRLYYNGTEVGYYPESIWTSRGTTMTGLGSVDMYGEGVGPEYGVSLYQLGNGIVGTGSGAAKVSNYTLYGTTSTPRLQSYNWGNTPFYHNGNVTATSFTYGGPGLLNF